LIEFCFAKIYFPNTNLELLNVFSYKVNGRLWFVVCLFLFGEENEGQARKLPVAHPYKLYKEFSAK